jgi:hypothetical protein
VFYGITWISTEFIQQWLHFRHFWYIVTVNVRFNCYLTVVCAALCSQLRLNLTVRTPPDQVLSTLFSGGRREATFYNRSGHKILRFWLAVVALQPYNEYKCSPSLLLASLKVNVTYRYSYYTSELFST